MRKAKAKTKAPQDATLRNVRAARAAIRQLTVRLQVLEQQVLHLTMVVTAMEPDDPTPEA